MDIDQEGQAILEDLLPSTSRATPSPASAHQLAARRDLMIHGLVNGSINPALRPHLQREYLISNDDLVQAAADGRGRSIAVWRGPPGGGGGGGGGPSPSPPTQWYTP